MPFPFSPAEMCPEGEEALEESPELKEKWQRSEEQDSMWGRLRLVIWVRIISRKMKTEFKVGRAKKETRRFRERRKERLRRGEMEGKK